MRTFTFTHKNTGNIFTTSAENLEEAEYNLYDTIRDNYGWRVDDEEGEDEK